MSLFNLFIYTGSYWSCLFPVCVCVFSSCCYFLRLHETFDAPIIGLTCVCVFFSFSILFLTCCDIQCDSTVRARGLRLLLHNKMLQLTCPTLFPPQIDKHTHNLRSGRELSQFSCRAENCYPQMLNESWAGFRGGNSPKFFLGFFFFLFFIFYWPAMWHTTLSDVYWKEKQISWYISINSFVF